MAAPAAVRSSSPGLCPSFAVVCSFLERYGAALDLPEMTFPQMERYLRETSTVPKPLVELHVKLLRKLGKSVTADRWEKYLAKVCQDLNSTWAWELEQKGYQEMTMECKSSILKYLCECQFDDNLKFKTAINEEDPEKMRMQPIGRDRQGLMYWLQLDQDKNIRLYTEEQDDLDGSTWKCIVRTRDDLAEAVELLKAQVEPKQDQDQGGSRSASPTERESKADPEGTAVPEKKPEVFEEEACRRDEPRASTDPKPSNMAEEHTDGKMSEQPLKQVMKPEEAESVKQENTQVEVKEEQTDNKPERRAEGASAVIDNRVSTITAIIKSESRDTDAHSNAVSVVMAPASVVAKQEVNKEEEAERAVVRSNQQAKIPLKKRELKLAEGFQGNQHHGNHLNHSNSSSIIVCNPSVIQTKDGQAREREGKLPNSLVPSAGPAASRQELTNGRPPLKDGQNGVIGVIGQVGVIGHVGVIRSPLEHHRVPAVEQQERNGPSLEHRGGGAGEEGEKEKEANRQSVLVRKGPTETEAAAAAPGVLMEAQTARKPPPPPSSSSASSLSSSSLQSDRVPKVVERDEQSASVGISSLSQSSEEPKTRTAEDEGKNVREERLEGEKTGSSSHGEKDKDPGEKEERRREGSGADGESKENQEEKKSILGKTASESESAIPPPLKGDQPEGAGDGSETQVRVKDAGHASEGRPVPRERASSEIQKEGIRLKIKIPPHRRNKLRGREDKEEEAQEEGRSLRRSARICRSSPLPICRPSSKVAESQSKKQDRKQAPSSRTKEEEEEDEDEEEDEEQRSMSKKDTKAESDGQTRKRKGKRRHRRARWTNTRTKRRKLNEGGEEEESGREPREEGEDKEGERGEEESEGGSDSQESSQSEEIPNEDACTHCGLPNHPELILLCDSCDSGYHTACLRPPVMLIPDGEWFCPPCQHKLLCERLEEQLQDLDSALKKKERAEKRRERLVYVGISVENIIPEGDEEEEKSVKKKDSKKSKNLGRRSTRTRKCISYRFDDFDDAIDEAIEEDIREVCGAGTGRGKDMANILSEEGKETPCPIRSPARSARNRKRRRLNDLESDSTAAESEEEFMLSNSSEEEEFVVSGGDEEEEEEEDEDAGSEASGPRSRRVLKRGHKHQPSRTQHRARKRLRRRRRRSSEEEEEDSDEDINSERSSDMSDSDLDKKRRGLRRGHRQEVNYREASESSDNSRASVKKEKVKGRGRPRKQRLSSDYSDASSPSKDSDDDDDYEEEEDDDHRRRRVKRRRRDEEDLRRNRRVKRRRHEDEEEEEDDKRERGRRVKRRLAEEEEREKRRRLKRKEKEEEVEDLEKMGRGKRREMLSQQRRKRLALMLKKRHPSTDEEEDDDDESEESESSSEEDRPIRKRLNRIDSDDDEEEEEEDEEEEEGQETTTKKSSAIQRNSRLAGADDNDGAQEKGRARSLSPSNEHRTSRGPTKLGPGSPSAHRDSAGSDGQGRHNGPLHPEKEEGQTDLLNSVQNSPQS